MKEDFIPLPQDRKIKTGYYLFSSREANKGKHWVVFTLL